MYILKGNVIARMHRRTTNACGLIRGRRNIAREVPERDIGDLHFRSARVGAVVPAILRNSSTDRRTLEIEVFEKDVLDHSPDLRQPGNFPVRCAFML